eukprot:tig00020538_g10347.t1
MEQKGSGGAQNERTPLLATGQQGSRPSSRGAPAEKPSKLRACCARVFSKKAAMLIGFLLVLIVVATSNRILYKMMLNRYAFEGHSYAYFLNQWTVVLYCALAWIIVLYRMYSSGDITPEMRKYPMQRFAGMGLFDALSSFLGVIGGVYTAGQLQTLLDQGVIPWTMIASLVFLSARYNRLQFMGAFLICCGVGLATVPAFKGGHLGANNRVSSIIVYATSSVPNALSNVYKEFAFKDQNMDIYYLTFWVSTWQFFLGFLFAPLQSSPYLMGQDAMPMSEIATNLQEGFLCFLGQASHQGDDCSGRASIVLAFLVVNFAYNALLLVVTKYGSAVLLVMTGALVIPVTNVVFTVKAVMGADAESFSEWDLAGLNVVLVGFVVYSFFGDEDFFAGAKAEGEGEGEGEEEEEGKVVMVLPSIGHLSVVDINLLPNHRRHHAHAQQIRENYMRKLGIVAAAGGSGRFAGAAGAAGGGSGRPDPISVPKVVSRDPEAGAGAGAASSSSVKRGTPLASSISTGVSRWGIGSSGGGDGAATPTGRHSATNGSAGAGRREAGAGARPRSRQAGERDPENPPT